MKLEFNGGLGTEFYTIQLAIKLFRGSTNTKSPELENLTLVWYGATEPISSWTLNVLATGTEGDETFTTFEAIYNTKILVPFHPSGDPKKTSYNVKLTQMPSREWWEEQGGREGRFQIVLEEVFNG